MKRFTRRIGLLLVASTYIASMLLALQPVTVNALNGADFNPGRIIDDHVFFDSTTMTADNIQAFLNSKVPVCDTNGTKPYNGTTRASYSASKGISTPFICLKDFRMNVQAMPADTYCGGSTTAGNKSAAEIIKSVSDACSISPKILIVLLQKEQAFVTDDWPWPVQYTKATGFGCPDSALSVSVDQNQNGCYDDYEGFFNQMYYAARQYQRYAKQASSYNFKHNRQNFIQYNPNGGCSGTNVFIQNQATAGLYNYTPYQPNQAALNNLYGTGDGCSAYGNRNFWRLFADWFGSPITGICYNGNASVSTDVVFRKYDSRAESADLLIKSGSGSGCIESHVMNGEFGSWKAHIASNQPGVTNSETVIDFGKLDGSTTEYPVLFGISNTGSGKIEAHVWNKDMRSWLVHTASNQNVVNPADATITFGDLNGDGIDEPILVVYRNTGTGMIEFHGWSNGMQGWAYHVATNRTAVDPAQNQVVFANLDGAAGDEAVLIAQTATGSGMVEFHVWKPGQWAWQSHTASNSPAINPANTKITFADLNGDGRDEAVLIGLRQTGSGKVEFHTWHPGFTSWQSHAASIQPAL